MIFHYVKTEILYQKNTDNIGKKGYNIDYQMNCVNKTNNNYEI